VRLRPSRATPALPGVRDGSYDENVGGGSSISRGGVTDAMRGVGCAVGAKSSGRRGMGRLSGDHGDFRLQMSSEAECFGIGEPTISRNGVSSIGSSCCCSSFLPGAGCGCATTTSGNARRPLPRLRLRPSRHTRPLPGVRDSEPILRIESGTLISAPQVSRFIDPPLARFVSVRPAVRALAAKWGVGSWEG